MKKLVLLLLLTISLGSPIHVEAGFEHFKIVNGDAGCEFIIKGSTRLVNIMPIVYKDDLIGQIVYGAYIGLGFSEQYTAPRSNQFAYNHYGDRLDWSLGAVLGDIEAIYTHSIRNKYSGASPDALFFNQDVDSFKLRYKGEF